jgi:hypothetical protein
LESSRATVERGLKLLQRFAGPLEKLLKQLPRDRALPAGTSMNRGVSAPERRIGQRGESPLQVRDLRPVADCDCVAVRRGGEQEKTLLSTGCFGLPSGVFVAPLLHFSLSGGVAPANRLQNYVRVSPIRLINPLTFVTSAR